MSDLDVELEQLARERELEILLAALKERIDVEPDEIDVTDSSHQRICAVGVDGCTVTFIWTSNPNKLICIHAEAGTDNLRHKAYLGSHQVQDATVNAVTIVAPDQDNLDIVKDEVKRLFPGIEPKEELYPYAEVAKAEDSQEWWDIEGNVDNPGKVAIQHEVQDLEESADESEDRVYSVAWGG